MRGVVHHGAGQGVETHKVRHSAGSVLVLHYETLDDVWLGDEPVQDVGRGEDWCEVKPLQEIIEQLSNSLYVCGSELSYACSDGDVKIKYWSTRRPSPGVLVTSGSL